MRVQVLAGRTELSRESERVLVDCLQGLDRGAASDDCLTRYPKEADSLRGVLDVRAQLLAHRSAAPSPTTFAAGREALLAHIVHPLASSHPGSMATESHKARGLTWRPASRAAFTGALFFAMASCAIGVSATPAGDKVSDVLPNIPTIDVPEQRPPYPFPEYNVAPQDSLPTAEPDTSDPVQTAPQPAVEPGDSQDAVVPDNGEPDAKPTKPSNPGDTWLPPINAQETDTPDVETPDPTALPNDSESSHDDDGQDSSNDSEDGEDSSSSDDNASSDDGSDDKDDAGGGSRHGETSAEAAPSS